MEMGFIFDDPPFASCHASTVVEVDGGRLLAAWFGGTEEGAPDVVIWLSEWGRTGWSPPRAVASDPEQPCWNPVLFAASSGEVLLFYKAGPSPSQWSGLLKRSRDGGLVHVPTGPRGR
jgi:predicted neuraminidase